MLERICRRSALLPGFALAAAVVLAGCASPVAPTAPEPSFRLPPETLGRALAWQQRLQVTAQGIPRPALDALLEVDASSVRLAVLGAGQTLARLRWDGRELQAEQARGWPREISPARVLSDLQLALWPMAPLRAALPGGAMLVEEGPLRLLYQHGTLLATVRGAGSRHIEIVHHRLGYTLRIDSVALGEGAP